jgi:hypothetical protein
MFSRAMRVRTKGSVLCIEHWTSAARNLLLRELRTLHFLLYTSFSALLTLTLTCLCRRGSHTGLQKAGHGRGQRARLRGVQEGHTI